MVVTSETEKPLVVISHSQNDAEWLQWLRPQLDVLATYGHIEVWDDQQITAGQDKFFALDEQLERAAIAVCLISANYLASPFIAKQEVNFLLERRQRDGLLLLPILVKPCVWQAVPWLKRIQMIPRDAQPVSTAYQGREDEIFAQAAQFIFDYASQLSEERTSMTLRSLLTRQENFTEAARFALDAVAASKGLTPVAKAVATSDVRVDLQRLPETGYKFFGREQELQLLDQAWNSDTTNLLSLIAWGGVGKSTLVTNWLDRLETDDYRGARQVFAWSFYSQGTKEQVTSADYFFDEALRWFGAQDYAQLSAWDKGKLLADLVRRERTLLVLDGLEPLQSGNPFDRGTIKDPGLKTLLAELIHQNTGLCVVTSREKLTDFSDGASSLSQIDLEHISSEAGRSLLRVGRVHGSDAELEQATREFGQHALAINLLTAYLHDIPGHHVSARAHIPDLDVPEEQGKHPRRVIAALEALLGEGSEIELLRVLGLFDRPAPMDQIRAVVDESPIDGLTTHLHGLSNHQWHEVLERLRELGLIARQSQHRSDDVDAHPLVREHFAEQLRDHFGDAVKEAHRRLYEHLKQSAPELPDTIQDMMPLYHAVAHGCQAELWQEALDEVFFRRIRRGQEAFSYRKLGVHGMDLGAVSCFFASAWNRPIENITEADQGWVLGEAGITLRALGHLAQTSQPMQAALGALITQEAWTNAAINAKNLSELYLTLGDVSAAVRAAEQSVELADRSGDAFEPMVRRTALANALHQSARARESLVAFREAEAMQQERQPEYPLLYSLRGFLYCDLLLDTGESAISDVRNRAEKTFEWGRSCYSLLDIALDHLTLGRTHLLEALLQSEIPLRGIRASGSSEAELAEQHLNESVSFLRQSGVQEHLPRGLLARAALRRVQEQFDDAEHDLAEAIAERGSMLILQIDTAIERCRLHFATGDRVAARASFERAKQLIKQTEKPHQPHEPDWPDWEPPSYVNVFQPGEIVGYHRRNPEIEALEDALSGPK